MCFQDCACPIIEELPDGFGKDQFGQMYRRFKWDGPNYGFRTPVTHNDRMRIGCKHDFYRIDPEKPNVAIRR